MKTFEFNEYNRATLELPVLTQADQPGNENLSASGEENRESGLVEIAFMAEGNSWEYTQQPTPQQLNSLEFIKNNQQAILEQLYDYTKNTLYPVHIGYIGFDEVSFPEINSVEDLRNTLGINAIILFREYKEDIAYWAFECDFTGDFEHGTTLVMHQLKVLGWQEDLTKELVIADQNT